MGFLVQIEKLEKKKKKKTAFIQLQASHKVLEKNACLRFGPYKDCSWRPSIAFHDLAMVASDSHYLE